MLFSTVRSDGVLCLLQKSAVTASIRPLQSADDYEHVEHYALSEMERTDFLVQRK